MSDTLVQRMVGAVIKAQESGEVDLPHVSIHEVDQIARICANLTLDIIDALMQHQTMLLRQQIPLPPGV